MKNTFVDTVQRSYLILYAEEARSPMSGEPLIPDYDVVAKC